MGLFLSSDQAEVPPFGPNPGVIFMGRREDSGREAMSRHAGQADTRGGVVEDAQKGLDRYWGGGLQIDDQPAPMDWREDWDRGDAALATIREHLKIALNLMTQAATETAAAAEQVGHLSSPINNDDLAERYALVDQLTAGMTPPRRLNVVPPPEDAC